MSKKFMCMVAMVSATGAVTLFAQEATIKAGEGALMLEKKTYPLKHALAYETTIDNEQAIVVVPEGAELIDPRFSMLTPTSAPPVVGLAYSAATAEDDPADNVRLVVGAEGVTFVDADEQLTVRFRDCVAALRFADDVFMLYAADGTMISVAAAEWTDGRSALARVRAGLDPERIVDANPEEPLGAVQVVGSDD